MILYTFLKILQSKIILHTCWMLQSWLCGYRRIVPQGVLSWHISLLAILVHLNQSGFASNLVESFFCEAQNKSPLATPHPSSFLVILIAPLADAYHSPAQLRCMQAYQSLIGSIGWLAGTTQLIFQ
jgi:hypothetical protein